MELSITLVISLVIQPPEGRGESAERPCQPKLGAEDAIHKTQLGLAGKSQAAFGFRLDFRERRSDRQAERERCGEAVTRKRQFAGPIEGVERPAHQVLAAGRVFRPRHHERAHGQVGSRLITSQATFLDQVISELAEPISVSEVAKARPGKKAQPGIAVTRRVTVAVFEAQANQAADNE